MRGITIVLLDQLYHSLDTSCPLQDSNCLLRFSIDLTQPAKSERITIYQKQKGSKVLHRWLLEEDM